MKVIVFFVILVTAFWLWRVAAKSDRKFAKKTAFRFAVPVVLAAVITIALLAFAFNFNGKLI